jgi:hypothetical protein
VLEWGIAEVAVAGIDMATVMGCLRVLMALGLVIRLATFSTWNRQRWSGFVVDSMWVTVRWSKGSSNAVVSRKGGSCTLVLVVAVAWKTLVEQVRATVVALKTKQAFVRSSSVDGDAAAVGAADVADVVGVVGVVGVAGAAVVWILKACSTRWTKA